MIYFNIMSIFVNDPQEAQEFYVNKVGFVKKNHHESINYITVGLEDSNFELLLEPNENVVAKNYQEGLYKQGIPAASFGTSNIDEEYQRLVDIGVKFTLPPSKTFGVRLAIFDDEQGNLIQIVESKG